MDVGLLHVVKQAAVLAVARIVFRADADAGEVADLVFRHASHTEMVRDIVPENGLTVVGAEIAKHVETKFPDRAVEVRSLSVTMSAETDSTKRRHRANKVFFISQILLVMTYEIQKPYQ